MNAELKQLYDKKGKVVKQMEDCYRNVKAREDKKATADEERQFDAWDKELEEINGSIRFHERASKLEAERIAEEGTRHEAEGQKEKKFAEATIATAEKRSEVYAKAKKSGFSSLDEEERSVYNTVLRDTNIYNKWLRQGVENLTAEERTILNTRKEIRAQSVGTASAGGYTVPEGFSGYIIEKMKFISELLNWADIINTDSGNLIPFPINDDTANTGELIGENADLSSSSADLVFSVYNLNAYKFSSKMIKVSAELLQDNGVNLESYLGKKLAERVARITNSYFTTGTGSSQPQGYVTGATQGKVSASATAFTADEIVDLMDSIDRAYQNAPKFGFAMHQNILSAIKKLSHGTSDDRPLWLPSIREGAPDTLYGKPYFINNAMASALTTGQKIMACGDWDAYKIRRVNGFSLRRLTERYAELDQVAFFGLARMDAFVSDSSAIKYLELT